MKVFMNVSSCFMRVTSLRGLLKSILAFEFIILSQSFRESTNRKMMLHKHNTDQNSDSANAHFYQYMKRAKHS